jgi:hypothetical protein
LQQRRATAQNRRAAPRRRAATAKPLIYKVQPRRRKVAPTRREVHPKRRESPPRPRRCPRRSREVAVQKGACRPLLHHPRFNREHPRDTPDGPRPATTKYNSQSCRDVPERATNSPGRHNRPRPARAGAPRRDGSFNTLCTLMANPNHSAVFLGVAKRALLRGVDLDVLGLSTLLFLPFFPQRMTGLSLLFAVPRSKLSKGKDVAFEVRERARPNNKATTTAKVADTRRLSTMEEGRRTVNEMIDRPAEPVQAESAMHLLGPEHSDHFLIAMPAPPLWVSEPGKVDVYSDGALIGSFTIGGHIAPGITDEERAELLERGASKRIVLTFGCAACGKTLRIAMNLDPADRECPGDHCLLKDAPSEWACACGNVVIATEWLKRGAHDLFRHPARRGEEFPIDFTPAYERGRLAGVRQKYDRLIETDCAEEDVQKFLDEHSVFWAFLSPRRIIPKPRVLSQYIGDFAVLSSHRVLYLVELEKPSARLATAKGGMHSDLRKGLDQVKDWRQKAREHWQAVRDVFGLGREQVDDLRFLVVAGLSRKERPEHLSAIRMDVNRADTTLLTFDELGAFLTSLEASLPR